MVKNCARCLTPKSLDSFYSRKGICKDCDRARAQEQYRKQGPLTGPAKEARARRYNLRQKQNRKDPAKRPQVIYRDARNSDRKNQRSFDLTVQFIAALIEQGCSYCGCVDLKMTVDRIDNTQGHLQTNVVPACIRCNLLRRDMPYPAWLEIAKAVRRVREEGLFDGWIGGIYQTHPCNGEQKAQGA